MRLDRFAIAAACALALACGSGASLEVDPAPTTGKAGTCATCHLADFRSAPHHVGERPTTCATCHAQDAWHPSRVEHTWPLTGAHARAACFECHKGEPPIFEGTKGQCVDCHRSDYEKAPEHVQRGFPTTCQECHGAAVWKPLLPGASAPKGEPAPVVPPSATAPSASPGEPATKPPVRLAPSAAPAPRRTPVTPTAPTQPPDVTTQPSRRKR